MTFEGVIDVVNQKAIYLGPGEANEGLKYEITEIPAEHQERAKAALAELIDAVSNKDDEIAEPRHRGKADHRAGAQGGHPAADLQD